MSIYNIRNDICMPGLLSENAIFKEENSQIRRSSGIRDGYISFVSEKTYLNVKIRKKIDVKENFVFPGFIDSHIHVLATAEFLTEMAKRFRRSSQ